jgi:hypothetical protein
MIDDCYAVHENLPSLFLFAFVYLFTEKRRNRKRRARLSRIIPSRMRIEAGQKR